MPGGAVARGATTAATSGPAPRRRLGPGHAGPAGRHRVPLVVQLVDVDAAAQPLVVSRQEWIASKAALSMKSMFRSRSTAVPGGMARRSRVSLGTPRKVSEPEIIAWTRPSCSGRVLTVTQVSRRSASSAARARPTSTPSASPRNTTARHRHQVDRHLAVAVHLSDMAQVDHLHADEDEQRRQRLHRDQLDRPAEPEGEHQHPHPVQDRREPGAPARLHVRGAADDHTRHRQAAQRAGDHVGHALPGSAPGRGRCAGRRACRRPRPSRAATRPRPAARRAAPPP